MAVFSVALCLFAVFTFVIVNTMTEGRSLRRHHHHSHLDDYDFEKTVLRNLLPKHFDDDSDYHDSYMEKHESSDDFDRSLLNTEYEDIEDRVPSPHRFKHEYALRSFEHLRRRNEDLFNNPERLSKVTGRKKRHNGRHGSVSYRRITDQDKRDILLSKQYDHELELHSDENDGFHESFELEVKEAQNSSICNYTVVSIPDPRGSRMPRDLEHVMCNHVGSSCQGAGTYCCIQTYKKIEVVYGDGDKEPMKLYVGCVCAQQVFNDLRLVESSPIHD